MSNTCINVYTYYSIFTGSDESQIKPQKNLI